MSFCITCRDNCCNCYSCLNLYNDYTIFCVLQNHSSPRLTPRSTPTSSPRSRAAQSPPPTIPPPRGSAPTTPGDSLAGVGGDVREAFTQQSSGSGISSVRNLRNDLLVAADSVTNAMSSLVKELNSGTSLRVSFFCMKFAYFIKKNRNLGAMNNIFHIFGCRL